MSSEGPEGHSIKEKLGYPYENLEPKGALAFTNDTAYDTLEAWIGNGADDITACCYAYNIGIEEAQQAIKIYRLSKKLERINRIKVMAEFIERTRKAASTTKRSR